MTEAGVEGKLMRTTLRCAVALALVTAGASACGQPPQGCGEKGYSAGFERIGVMRSADGGVTWQELPDACFHAPHLLPVDPAPVADGEGVALYFLDLLTLGGESTVRTIYRSTSPDGVTWSPPEPAFGFGDRITDPYVLRLTDGSFRMYLMHPVAPSDIISAWSPDGHTFTPEAGVRTDAGAIPGALLLPDGRVRLFVAGDPSGITSLISADGLAFTPEDGVRVPAEGARTTNPHPIARGGGGYLMAYDVQPMPDAAYPGEPARLDAIEIRIAHSDDGMTWTTEPAAVAHGNVPALVETSGGILFLFYVDASHAPDLDP